MRRLFTFLLQKSSGALAPAIVTGILSGVATAALMAIVNTMLSGEPRNPAFMALAFVGATLAVLLTSLGSRLLLLRILSRATLDMRLSLCARVLKSPLWRVESQETGTLIAALSEDILVVSETLSQFPLLCINCAIVAACVCYLFWLSWILTLVFLAVFALGVILHELIARRARRYLAEGRDQWDELVGLYHGLVLGNKELKLHRQRRLAFVNEKLRPTAESISRLTFSWNKLFAIAASYGQAFYFIVIGALIFGAPLLVDSGREVLTGFTLLTIYLSGPLSLVVGALPTFQRAVVSLEKIESLGLSLAADCEEDVTLAPPSPPSVFEELKLRGVKYVYQKKDDDRPFILGPLDFQLVAGEVVFVAGGNGSGKSTFARLVAGLYVPPEGTISINGQFVTDHSRDEYRQNFTAIFSDYYLFDSLLGLVSDDMMERVTRYLRQLQLSRKVSLEGSEFSTLKLSQGQRKRLALLTAFMEERSIYIFDEWAADQDPIFKKVFYHEIIPELRKRGKTLLVISHDEQYYHVADRVVRIEDGVFVSDSLVEETCSGAAAVAADPAASLRSP